MVIRLLLLLLVWLLLVVLLVVLLQLLVLRMRLMTLCTAGGRSIRCRLTLRVRIGVVMLAYRRTAMG